MPQSEYPKKPTLPSKPHKTHEDMPELTLPNATIKQPKPLIGRSLFVSPNSQQATPVKPTDSLLPPVLGN